MKTFIVLVIACWACAYAWARPFHTAATLTVDKNVDVPSLDVGVRFEVPTAHIESHSQPAKAAAKAKVAKAAAKPKKWTCGQVYENAIGGRNSDCFWM